MILIALARLLAFTALAVLLRDRLLSLAVDIGPIEPPAKVVVGTVASGAIIGAAVTMSSFGAGAIGVTVLLMLYPRFSAVRIVGSDIAHAVPLVLIAGIGHRMIGDVDFTLLLNLLAGSIPGVIVGSLFSTRAGKKYCGRC